MSLCIHCINMYLSCELETPTNLVKQNEWLGVLQVTLGGKDCVVSVNYVGA